MNKNLRWLDQERRFLESHPSPSPLQVMRRELRRVIEHRDEKSEALKLPPYPRSFND